MTKEPSPQLTLLYDGGCPLCLREVRFLHSRDQLGLIAFVDIDAIEYNLNENAGIDYRQAMGRIHAINARGEVLRDVAVFREAYRLVGLGWLYAPSTWPGVAGLINRVYAFWAARRLKWTGRPNLDQLCEDRCVRV